MNWKYATALCLLVVAAFTAVYYLGRHTMAVEVAGKPAVRDTVTYKDTLWLPPATVTPNPSPAKPRPDLTLKDSVETLIATIANKDSLIRSLMSTQGTEQEFVSKDPTGLDISGEITVLYSPLSRDFLTHITLNPVLVPVKIVTITYPPIIETTTPWGWLAGALGAGVIIGVFL